MTFEVHFAFYGDAVVKASVSPNDSLAPNKRNMVMTPQFFHFSVHQMQDFILYEHPVPGLLVFEILYSDFAWKVKVCFITWSQPQKT